MQRSFLVSRKATLRSFSFAHLKATANILARINTRVTRSPPSPYLTSFSFSFFSPPPAAFRVVVVVVALVIFSCTLECVRVVICVIRYSSSFLRRLITDLILRGGGRIEIYNLLLGETRKSCFTFDVLLRIFSKTAGRSGALSLLLYLG